MPGILIAVVAATVAVAALDLAAGGGLAVLGALPAGLPVAGSDHQHSRLVPPCGHRIVDSGHDSHAVRVDPARVLRSTRLIVRRAVDLVRCASALSRAGS